MTVIQSKLSARQRELGRHALGLALPRRRSYRNRFFAGPGHADFADWQAMALAGLATRSAKPMAAGYLFSLTVEGATLCLDVGETLDPEDFPEVLA